MPLPTTKTTPTLDFQTANTFLYGPPGIGKTTFATNLSPDDTLLAATEPGYGGIEAYVEPVNSWDRFKTLVKELYEPHSFKLVAVDTVDVLAALCQSDVVKGQKVSHPSDLEWGKGWELVEKEFQLVLGPLMQHPQFGVLFIGHAEEKTIERSAVRGGNYTVAVPTVGPKSLRKFLLGACDFVFYAESKANDDGVENRIIHTSPSETWVAKQRTLPGGPLPDVLPLDAETIRAEIEKRQTAA